MESSGLQNLQSEVSDMKEETHSAVNGVKSMACSSLEFCWSTYLNYADVLNESLSLINYFSNAFIESLKIQKGHLRASSFTEFYERNYIL